MDYLIQVNPYAGDITDRWFGGGSIIPPPGNLADAQTAGAHSGSIDSGAPGGFYNGAPQSFAAPSNRDVSYQHQFDPHSQLAAEMLEMGPFGSPAALYPFAWSEHHPIDIGLMTTENAIELSPVAAPAPNNRAYTAIVTVTRPDGSTYIPQTAVKNDKQRKLFRLPIGTPIPIAVPGNVDPQALVNEWGSESAFNGLIEFGRFWLPKYGSHDYKRQYGKIGPMYDAFGNFEYGATGAALARRGQFGASEGTLVEMGNILKFGTNDPINTNDIISGFDAIASGGTLGTIYIPIP